MPHFLLFYETAPDYLERRVIYRESHLAHAKMAVARGELLLGGAFDPADGAVLLFVADGAKPLRRSRVRIRMSSTASSPIGG